MHAAGQTDRQQHDIKPPWCVSFFDLGSLSWINMYKVTLYVKYHGYSMYGLRKHSHVKCLIGVEKIIRLSLT